MRRLLPLSLVLLAIAALAFALILPIAYAPAEPLGALPATSTEQSSLADPSATVTPMPTTQPTEAPPQPTPLPRPTIIPTATALPTATPVPTITPVLTTDGWLTRSTTHYRLFAFPQTDAARDLDQLMLVAESAYASATTFISPTGTISISVYLVPRVFWQGGVAYGSNGPLLIAHLDRNYTAISDSNYLTHETVHALGAALLPPNGEVGGLLGEGLAVYSTGGHYSAEPFNIWVAAIVETPSYIPLCVLRDDFYAVQHEIAYLEAASYTSFLIETYGLQVFTEMYMLQAPQRGHPDLDSAAFCEADNQRSVAPLNKTNAALEQEWRDWLSRQSPSVADDSAVTLETHFFDTMRSYQERFDPPARQLPPPPADWTAEIRQAMSAAPHDIPAIVLETMLLAARQALLRADSVRATQLLASIDAAVAQGSLPNDPLTSQYNEIVTLFIELGYEPVQLEVSAEDALAIVQLPDRTRYQARLLLRPAGWRVVTWEPD